MLPHPRHRDVTARMPALASAAIAHSSAHGAAIANACARASRDGTTVTGRQRGLRIFLPSLVSSRLESKLTSESKLDDTMASGVVQRRFACMGCMRTVSSSSNRDTNTQARTFARSTDCTCCLSTPPVDWESQPCVPGCHNHARCSAAAAQHPPAAGPAVVTRQRAGRPGRWEAEMRTRTSARWGLLRMTGVRVGHGCNGLPVLRKCVLGASQEIRVQVGPDDSWRSLGRASSAGDGLTLPRTRIAPGETAAGVCATGPLSRQPHSESARSGACAALLPKARGATADGRPRQAAGGAGGSVPSLPHIGSGQLFAAHSRSTPSSPPAPPA